MSKSFTPGLKILKKFTIFKDRILPIKGSTKVSLNEIVSSDKIVASSKIPGNVRMVNIANELNIDSDNINECLTVKVGEKVNKNQVIAQSKGLFGLFKAEVKSPIDGEISQVSDVTGQLVILEPPEPINIDAYIPGEICKIYEEEGVQIKSNGTYVQGIIGVGGEKKGKLKVISKPNESVRIEDINSEHKDCILVIGSFLDYEVYQKAKSVGVTGIITGSFSYNSLSEILGYSLGVAITGTEEQLTIIITEGFGHVEMSQKTFDLLSVNDNKYISINGSTQIRAGVLRPEVFIYDDKIQDDESNQNIDDLVIALNSRIRVIREPFFGKLGTVIDLPHELHKMESGTMTRVAKIKFDDKTEEIIPRTNLEVILSN